MSDSQIIPQNLDVEHELLGLAIESPRVLRRAVADLAAQDFYDPRNALVFEALRQMSSEGESIDLKTLIAHLKRVKKLSEPIDQTFVIRLATHSAVPAMAKQYIAELTRCSYRRRIVEAGDKLHDIGYDDALDLEAGLSAAETKLYNVRIRKDGITGEGGVESGELMDSFCDAYFEGEDLDLVPFPLRALNRIGGGQRKGQVVVSGGWSGDGKSWWALDCVEEAARAGNRCAVFTLEVPKEEIAARFIAMGGHDFTKVLNRTLPAGQIAQRVSEVRAMNVRIVDDALNLNQIKAELIRARVEGKPFRYIAIDHLHLMDIAGGDATYRLGLGRVLRDMKAMAKQFGVTIHVLAQLKRTSGDKAAKFPPPNMQDFRESGAIENIADYAMFVYRERDDNQQQMTASQVLVAKVRSGFNPGRINATFDVRSFRFRERA